MKRYLVLALAALALGLAWAPSAFATAKIKIFDPDYVTCDNVGAGNCPLAITDPNASYSAQFIPAELITGIDTTGYSYFLWLDLVPGNGLSIPNFTFNFDVPDQGPDPGSSLICDGSSTDPLAVIHITCPSTLPTNGSGLTISFSFNPAVQNGADVYLGTNFLGNPGDATVTVSTPEPGALGMFGLGLLAIGVGVGWQRRRQTSRSNGTA